MHKVCVMTDVHWIFDNRINKEIKTLLNAGYDVSYVAPAKQEEAEKYRKSNPDVKLFPINRYENRRQRMTSGVREAYKAALSTGADIFHFHDPELIQAGILFKLKGKKVIYDVHENYISVFLSRRKKTKVLKYISVISYWIFERIADLLFDGIITVNEEVHSKFRKNKSIIIPNYPELSFFNKIKHYDGDKSDDKKVIFLYLGGISIERGIKEMIKAAEIASKKCKMKLVVIGRPIDNDSRKYLNVKKDFFEYITQKPYFEALSLAKNADVGMITLYPTKNHLETSPVKLFEYMALGLPIIASDFPKWRNWIGRADCAFFVDPMNLKEIAEKMIKLCEDTKLREEMGKRAQKLVIEKYSWSSIEKSIVDLYSKILK